jgi:hypothetical protein
VPLVVKFSSPNEMVPLESVMEPSAKVKLPKVEPVSALRVPVVDRFSSPNEMTPPSSVIVPLFRGKYEM